MGRLFIVTYDPLVSSAAGRHASDQYGIPPFVDGSIRREPDLEHDCPSISCLCRAGKFAPRLQLGDHVVYMAGKRGYGLAFRHWRLTAVLRVARLFDSHRDAADWYLAQGHRPPNNCMVKETIPHPVRETHRKSEHDQLDEEEWLRAWDLGYRLRARRNGRFVACQPIWRELGWSAPVVQDDDLHAVFGRRPGTMNPGPLPIRHLRELASQLRIAFPPSAP